MTVIGSLEKKLETVVFVDPKSDENKYNLFQAVFVTAGKKNEGRAEFESLGFGIDTKFLRTNNLENMIPVLNQFIDSAVNTDLPDIYEACCYSDFKSGTLGAAIPTVFKTKAKMDRRTNDKYVVDLSGMKQKSIEETKLLEYFLTACVPAFCLDEGSLRNKLSSTPTKISNNVECGIAFITTRIVGNVNFGTASSYNARMEGSGSDPGAFTARASAENVNSAGCISIGQGVVGIRAHFFHLLKTKQKPYTLVIKKQFPITKSNASDLTYLIGTMATRAWRKVFHVKRRPAIICYVMTGSYDDFTTGDYLEYVKLTLKEIKKSETYDLWTSDTDTDTDTESESEIEIENDAGTIFTASLRIARETEIVGTKTADDPPGSFRGGYTGSNNVLYTSTIEDLKSISKKIMEKGTVNIQGKIIDGIKPVIKCNAIDSLPITYKPKNNNTSNDIEVPPNLILRTERDNSLVALWTVTDRLKYLDINGSNDVRILTAYDETNWHVIESIEYVDKDDRKNIESLQNEGYFEVHKDDISSKEELCCIRDSSSSFTSFSCLTLTEVGNDKCMMGRHVLALKEPTSLSKFFKRIEVNDQTVMSDMFSNVWRLVPEERASPRLVPEERASPRLVPAERASVDRRHVLTLDDRHSFNAAQLAKEQRTSSSETSSSESSSDVLDVLSSPSLMSSSFDASETSNHVQYYTYEDFSGGGSGKPIFVVSYDNYKAQVIPPGHLGTLLLTAAKETHATILISTSSDSVNDAIHDFTKKQKCIQVANHPANCLVLIVSSYIRNNRSNTFIFSLPSLSVPHYLFHSLILFIDVYLSIFLFYHSLKKKKTVPTK